MKKTLLLTFLSLFLFTFASAQFDSYDDNQDPVEKVSLKSNAKIYPNPAIDFIGLQDNKGVSQISVFNVVGKKLKSFVVSESDRYYIADLPKGMYLVQLLSDNGKILKTQRLNKR